MKSDKLSIDNICKPVSRDKGQDFPCILNVAFLLTSLRKWLHPLDFNGSLEEEFRHKYNLQNKKLVNGTIVCGIIIAVLLTIMQWRTVPAHIFEKMWWIYPCFTIPVFCLSIYLHSHEKFGHATQKLGLIAGTAAAIGSSASYYIPAVHGAPQPYEALILTIFACYLVLGLRLDNGIKIGVIVAGGFTLTGFALESPREIWLYQVIHLFGANILGAIGCYYLEYNSRENFLARRDLHRQAKRDGLTGLYNKQAFDENYSKAFSQACRDQTLLSILFIDIDYFKQYNDYYGHLAGDECLLHVAAILESSVQRPLDMVARYGGEEFVVLLYGASPEGAKTVSERILEDIRSANIAHATSLCGNHLTVSIGAGAGIPSLNQDNKEFIALSDKALYQAKSNGRNQAVIREIVT